MSYNGSGTFNINTSGQPVVTGTAISSTAFNALTADLATGLSNAMTRDGQSPATSDIPMGGNKITGLDNGTASTDAVALGQVNTNTASSTLNVPGTYATIQAALDYLDAHTIPADTTVTIQVADGTYNLTAALVVNHPQGAQIRIVGNETTPASVILSVAGSGFDCLTVSNGNTLGYLNGFTFYKTAKALAADNSTAILANNGATIICGDDIVVDNWYYGIAARNGSFIECDYAQVDHSGDVGIWAFVGSSVQCRNAVSNNAIDVANDLGFGIQAEYGSTVDCQSASATGCRIAGIAALSNSHVRALSATTSTNTGSGLLARDGGTIEAHAATSSSNTRYGIESIADGHVYYSSITAASNTIANFAPKAYFDNTTALGARVVADDGNLRLDTSGAYGTYFNTSGGLQFGVTNSSGAVNYFIATGASDANAYLSAAGSATDIAANVSAKNDEVVRLKSNGKTAMQAYNASASAVNYVQADGGTAGNPAVVSAQGDDPVIDLRLNAKSTGYIIFGAAHNATGDVACNGYISIKDSGGNIRKLMTTA